MSRLPEATRIEVVALRTSGKTFREISRHLGIGYRTAREIAKKWLNHKTVRDLPRSGRPRKFDARSRRRLRRIFNNREVTSIDDGRRAALVAGLPAVSHGTMHSLLKELGLHAYRMQRKPFTKPGQKAIRLHWASARRCVCYFVDPLHFQRRDDDLPCEYEN